jgi:hypothetical protein
MPPDDSALRSKLDLLELSYKEVLDATKHQDDKVGRFLTAVSFLVIGAITLGTKPELMAVRYQLEPSRAPVPLPAWLLILFFMFIAMSLALLVTAMGARLHVPGGSSSPPRSHLFFLSIAQRSDDEWAEMWSPPSRVVGSMFRAEYQREIMNIARRAKQKYSRTLWAGASLQMALLCLGLAAVLALVAHIAPGAGIPSVVDWAALEPRLAVGFFIATYSFALAADFFWFESHEGQREMRIALLVCCPIYALVMVVHPGDLWHPTTFLGFYKITLVFQLILAAAGLACAWGTPVKRVGAARAGLVVLAALSVLGPSLSFADQLELGHLVAAGSTVPLLLLIRLFKQPGAAPPGQRSG